jgi:hypothetical protein
VHPPLLVQLALRLRVKLGAAPRHAAFWA